MGTEDDGRVMVPAEDGSGKIQRTNPDLYEQQHVHEVYSAISTHFSATRYRTWPRVAQFLEQLPPYTMVADVGCGNGKYFAAAQHVLHAHDPSSSSSTNTPSGHPTASSSSALINAPRCTRFVVGLDYSEELLRLTQRTMADPNLSQDDELPNDGQKRKRRRPRTVAPQHVEHLPRTDTIRADARRCPLRGGIFDAAISIAVLHHYATHERRVEAVGELLRLLRPDGGVALIYVWALEQPARTSRKVDPASGDALIRWEVNQKFDASQTTYQRFYHMFRKGELEEVCREASTKFGIPCVHKEVFYDHENWCIVVARTAA